MDATILNNIDSYIRSYSKNCAYCDNAKIISDTIINDDTIDDKIILSLFLIANTDIDSYNKMKAMLMFGAQDDISDFYVCLLCVFYMAKDVFVCPTDTEVCYRYIDNDHIWKGMLSSDVIHTIAMSKVVIDLRRINIGNKKISKFVKMSPSLLESIKCMLKSNTLYNIMMSHSNSFSIIGGSIRYSDMKILKDDKLSMTYKRCNINVSSYKDYLSWKEYMEPSFLYISGLLGISKAKSLLYIYSTIFSGKNLFKKLIIWYGGTNSGKSTLAKLFQSTLGDYAKTVPIQVLTSARVKQGSASPEMAMLQDTMIAFFNEPNYRDKINSGIVKELTGNDNVNTRNIYEGYKELNRVPMLTSVANTLLPYVTNDAALLYRYYIVFFPKMFVTRSQYNVISKYNTDARIDVTNEGMIEDVSSLSYSLLAILIRYYNKYITTGSIKQYRQMVNENNYYLGEVSSAIHYIRKNTTRKEGSTVSITSLLDSINISSGATQSTTINIVELQSILSIELYAYNDELVFDMEYSNST